jgi:hypothetical protein
MKDKIEELTSMTTSDVSVITPKIIAGIIEEIARDSNVWAKFYKVNRDLMSNGGTQVDFPVKHSGVTASWGMSAGHTLSATNMHYDAVTIAVTKGGVGIGFYGEALRQTNRDVIADAIREAGLVWGETIDIAAFEAMFPTATATANNKGTITGCNVGIMGIKSLNPSTVSGSIVNTAGVGGVCYSQDAPLGTITYWYCPSDAGVNTVTAQASSITCKDVLSAKAIMEGYKFRPKYIVVHPDKFADLVYDSASKFTVQKPGEAITTGVVGELWGLGVIVNCYCPKKSIVFVDTDNLGWQVIRKELELQKDPYTGMNIDALYFWGFCEKGFGVVNKRAYGVIHQIGTFAIADIGLGIGSGYP